MGVLTNLDVNQLIYYLVGSFAFGFVSGAFLRIFRRGAEKIL